MTTDKKFTLARGHLAHSQALLDHIRMPQPTAQQSPQVAQPQAQPTPPPQAPQTPKTAPQQAQTPQPAVVIQNNPPQEVSEIGKVKELITSFKDEIQSWMTTRDEKANKRFSSSQQREINKLRDEILKAINE